MVTTDDFAPYAPAKSVLGVVSRFRDRGLPGQVTGAALEQIGIPSTMTSRTLQTLRFLGLIDEGGNRTETFERLKRATAEEYQGQLAEILQAAYLSVFAIVQPTDSDLAIQDAFRRYEPSAQRGKMIVLFRALCAEAGLVEGKRRKPRTARKPTEVSRSNVTPKPKISDHLDSNLPGSRDGVENLTTDYRLISAIIQQLPRDGRWSKTARDRWLQLMTSAVDVLIQTDDIVVPQNGRHGIEEPLSGR